MTMLTWVILLYIGGMVLILAEFLVPGGVCGFIGALAVLGSAWLGCFHYPDYVLFIILGEGSGVIIGILIGLKLFPHTPVARKMILKDKLSENREWTSTVSDTSLINQKGVAVTPLRPAGIIEIADRRIDAVSDGAFIDSGSRVRVLTVEGSRVVVERVED